MRGTHANAPPEAAVKPQSLVSVSGESHLIDHEHIARVWIPDRAGRWMPRPVRIKEELLTLLGSLCQCRVERPDESNSHVVVKGDSEQAVERVFSKLKVMDEVAVRLQLHLYEYSLNFTRSHELTSLLSSASQLWKGTYFVK